MGALECREDGVKNRGLCVLVGELGMRSGSKCEERGNDCGEGTGRRRRVDKDFFEFFKVDVAYMKC